MRIRTIKPEFWSHPVMTKLPYDTRILAIGLLNLADDEGYFDADPDYIRGAVLFREDSTNVRRMLDELSRSGWITLSGREERPIGQVVNFRKHQRVDRAQPSRLKQYALADNSTNDRRALDERSTLEQGKERNTPIVPKGDIQTDESESSENEDPHEDPALTRAKAIFRMRPTTRLDRSQTRAYRIAAEILSATAESDWQQLEAYYAADILQRDDYRRRDLATLMNNWSGELTRAAAWAARTGFQPSENYEKKEGVAADPDDDIWRAALVAIYPDGNPDAYPDWRAVPDSLKAEIREAIAIAQQEAA